MDNVVFRRVLQLGKRGAHVHLDKFGGAFAHLHVVSAAHVADYIFGEVVAGDLDGFVGDDTAQRDNGDLGGAAAYVDYHVAGGGLHIQTDAEGGRHGFIDHVDIAAAGMFAGVAHGAYLHFGRSRGYAHDHAQRGGEPSAVAARFFHQAANHEFGGVEVGYHTLTQRPYGGDVRILASTHLLGFLAHGLELLGGLVDGHDGRLVDDNFVVMQDDSIGRSKVNGYLFCQ